MTDGRDLIDELTRDIARARRYSHDLTLVVLEVARMGVYGELDAWSLLGATLPEPSTLAASATVGRFVYIAGGHDGSAGKDTVSRAMILDPLDVPYFDDLGVTAEEGLGLAAGSWTWRVAALYAEDDGSNIADRKRPAIKTNSRIFDLGVAATDYRADAGKFTGHANYGLTGCEKTDKCFVEGAGGDVINTTGDALDFRPDRRIIKMKGVGIN